MKKIILILFLLPSILFAQKQNTWQLLLNNKVVLNGKIGEIKDYTVDNKTKSIKVKLNAEVTKKWNVSFIVMDTNKIEICRKKITVNDNIFSIAKKNFLNKDNKKQDLIVYTIRIPSDKKTAMLVKVAPQPLVKLSLQ